MSALTLGEAREAVGSVVDPEIPVLTIGDLGIVRDVVLEGADVAVTITPTYSGCPAMSVIESDIRESLMVAGAESVSVSTVHGPAWTTDWISESGRRKLAAFGIAPPGDPAEVICPQCSSDETRLISEFGSTACKALLVCEACGEPFDHFKTL